MITVRFFMEEVGINDLKKRITEVTIIHDFITNLIQVSENANILHRNFTAIEYFF